MFKKTIIIATLLLFPVFLLSQEKTENTKENKETKVPEKSVSKAKKDKDSFPVQAIHTESFDVKNFTMNKQKDSRGRGNQLEVNFDIINNTDYNWKLYVFVMASYDTVIMEKTSFGKDGIMPERIDTDLFVAHPDQRKNFEYTINGKTMVKKYPKNIKSGVDLQTGKPYVLDEKLHIRTYHLSGYRKKYSFFNNVTILIFDDEEKLMYRQVYAIKGKRR